MNPTAESSFHKEFVAGKANFIVQFSLVMPFAISQSPALGK